MPENLLTPYVEGFTMIPLSPSIVGYATARFILNARWGSFIASRAITVSDPGLDSNTQEFRA